MWMRGRWRRVAWAVLAAVLTAGCATGQGSPPSPDAGVLSDAALASDPVTGGVLAFGGTVRESDGRTDPSNVMRVRNGAGWRIVTPAGSSHTVPPPRQDPLLVDDRSTGRVLLFGGQGRSTVPPSPGAGTHAGTGTAQPDRWMLDGWSWDGHGWQQIAGYRAQVSGRVGYDPGLRAVILVGTAIPAAAVTDDSTTTVHLIPTATWLWTGAGWRQIATAPSMDTITSLVADPASGHLLGLSAQDPLIPPPCHHGPCAQPAVRRGTAHVWIFDGASWHRDPTDGALDQRGGVLGADPVTGAPLEVSDTGHTFTDRGGHWARLDTPTALHLRRAVDVVLRTAALPGRMLLVACDPADHAWTFDGRTWTQDRTVP